MNPTKIYDGSENYTAQIVRLGNISPLTGLDRLRGTVIQGHTVLVGAETSEGDIGVFFRSGTQLSNAYLQANNLYRHSERNADKSQRGLFEDNGRVKAVRLKGHLSTGFWMPLMSVNVAVGGSPNAEFPPSDQLKEGMEFNEFEGVEICRKYIQRSRTLATPGSKSSQRRAQRIQDRVNLRHFAEHPSTKHLLRCLNQFSPQSKIHITHKVHGTSARIGCTIVERKKRWYDKYLAWLGIDVVKTDHEHVVGSRRVIKSVGKEVPGHPTFYNTDIWKIVGEELRDKLKKDEVVYGEIIGWAGNKQIQSGYTYGLFPGQWAFMIYRITNNNSDGIAVDLCYPALRDRCKELGFKMVPHLFYGTAGEYLNGVGPYDVEQFPAIFANKLIDQYLDKPDILDPNIINEGIVIAIEGCNVHQRFKLKSPKFLEHESRMLDAGSEDMEEEQDNA